jgi:beta-ketodecanoyl-[acyl-carrier-protein] synthase
LTRIVVSGTGLFTPAGSVSNDTLVESLTTATLRWNEAHADEIARGDLSPRDLPSSKFIVRASGVGHRYVIDEQGVLDPTRLRPPPAPARRGGALDPGRDRRRRGARSPRAGRPAR